VPWRFRDHALFVCYAPAEAPEIAVAVVVEHGGHGGSDAAPVARAVLEAYFGLELEEAAAPAATPAQARARRMEREVAQALAAAGAEEAAQ
jgi:penicillin-binding protein 2